MKERTSFSRSFFTASSRALFSAERWALACPSLPRLALLVLPAGVFVAVRLGVSFSGFSTSLASVFSAGSAALVGPATLLAFFSSS